MRGRRASTFRRAAFARTYACSHGSATGELSPAELFYLRSRGISKEQARFMMIEGFAAEIVDEVSYTPLKERLRQLVKKRTAALLPAGA